LKRAFANELIPTGPTRGLTGYTGKDKKRGVLSFKETKDLFRLDWKDKRSMLINLVAMTTGPRISEIPALKAENVGGKYLTIGPVPKLASYKLRRVNSSRAPALPHQVKTGRR
jgi:hypothetical protein